VHAGVYDVRLSVTTFDGREGSVVRTVRVRSPRGAGKDDRTL
jgi:hypothetical protein